MFQRLTSSAGFTLIVAMTAVVIIGIMLGATGQSWKMFMKREREEELLFRGMQYQAAIERWYNPNPPKLAPGVPKPRGNDPSTRPLKDLKYLLQDPNSPGPKPYLRRLYTDPVTNRDFEPFIENGAITGVRSTSEEAPVKMGNFPETLKELEGKTTYKEWVFVYRAVPLAPATKTTVTGLPGVTGTGTPGTGTSGTGTSRTGSSGIIGGKTQTR